MTSSAPELPAGSVEIRSATEGDLAGRYVDAHLQRQSLGSRLLDDVAADLWPDTQRWFTEYVTGDKPAAAFYARHGFEFYRLEPDSRPHVEATYTWCTRSTTDAIDLF